MPTRLHKGHTPLRWYDRALAHPWSLSVASFWVAVGTLLTWATLSQHPTATVREVGPLAALVLAAFVLLGGVGVIAGVLWRGADSTGWTLEVIGLCLGGGAWGMWLLVEDSVYFQLLSAAFVAGATARVVAAYLNREAYHNGRAPSIRRRRLGG